MSGLSCVSRTFTSENSAATKNPLSRTSTTTPRTCSVMEMRAFQSMLQAHLPEDELQHVLQAEDADLAAVAAQHNRQPLAAPLQAPQSDFEPQVFIQEKRGLHEFAHRFVRVQGWLVEQRVQGEQPNHALLAIAGFPHREAGELPFPAQRQR